LTPHGGSRNGLAAVQKTASTPEAEIRHRALRLGALTVSVADRVEDYAPMIPSVVEKAREIVRRFTRLAAIERFVAAKAINPRGEM
jgi:histidine ammonia-lyase